MRSATCAAALLADTIAFDDAIKAVQDKMNAIDPGLANTKVFGLVKTAAGY